MCGSGSEPFLCSRPGAGIKQPALGNADRPLKITFSVVHLSLGRLLLVRKNRGMWFGGSDLYVWVPASALHVVGEERKTGAKRMTFSQSKALLIMFS